MAYTRADMKWLMSINDKNNIEVLVDCGDSYQWLMLSEGIIATRTIVFDHRYLGEELGVEKLDWATKPYSTVGETLV